MLTNSAILIFFYPSLFTASLCTLPIQPLYKFHSHCPYCRIYRFTFYSFFLISSFFCFVLLVHIFYWIYPFSDLTCLFYQFSLFHMCIGWTQFTVFNMVAGFTKYSGITIFMALPGILFFSLPKQDTELCQNVLPLVPHISKSSLKLNNWFRSLLQRGRVGIGRDVTKDTKLSSFMWKKCNYKCYF